MNLHNVPICELILHKLKQEKRSVAWLAKKVYMDPSNLRKQLKKQSMDSALLQRISNALNFSFFKYYDAEKSELKMKG